MSSRNKIRTLWTEEVFVWDNGWRFLPELYQKFSGVGKTTLIRKVCETLVSAGENVNGFYTEEVREGGRRVGFDVVTTTGERGLLSRVGCEYRSARHEHKVGQYVVDLASFEKIVLPLFLNVCDGKRGLFVIDEIGKMELFSQAFIHSVRQTLDSSVCSILGTIPISKGKPLSLVEEIRARNDVKVLMVTKENRDAIFEEVMSALKECSSTIRK